MMAELRLARPLNFICMIEDLKVGDRVFPVDYIVAKKLTSSVRIKNGRIVLRLSRFLRGGRRDRTVENFLKWAEKKLQKVSCDEFIEPSYVDGGRVYTHNKVYELRINFENRLNCSSRLKDDGIVVISVSGDVEKDVANEKIKDLVEKLIIKDQTSYLHEVIDELNQLHFQEKYNLVRIKRTRSRFGSCNSRGNISIAFRLLFAPREVFRYVCLHELAHLKEMNHSKRFWKLVEEAMPRYKESEKWLRDNGFMLG